MMNKKVIVASVLALAAAAAIHAFAQTGTTTPAAASLTIASNQPVLQVGPDGKVLMRGTVASVASGVLTVNSWGGAWTVNVGAGAQVLPVAVGNDITQFKTGDFVGIQGMVSQGGNWTINATIVRDWTYRQAVIQQQQQNMQSARQMMQNTPRNYVGTASNVSGSSFTLTVNGTADTVNVASGAEIVNRNWVTMPLTNIQSGDNVRVWGVNASGTITAQIVRDVTIPASTTQ